MYDKESLLVFHFKEKGWHGTEIMRYPDSREARDDLHLLMDYWIKSNNISQEEEAKIRKTFQQAFENSKEHPKLALEGQRETFQAEVVPYNEIANWVHIQDVTVIHTNRKGCDFANEFFTDREKAKARFREIAEENISKQKDRHSAAIQKITLDEYMREGRYSWLEKNGDEFNDIKMMTYRIKDFRRNKESYLDGQNKSVALGVIDALQRNEHYFMTPIEKRLATEDEIKLDGKPKQKVIVELGYKKSNPEKERSQTARKQ
jgi:hypothetical protein